MAISFNHASNTNVLTMNATNFMNGWTQGSFCFWATVNTITKDHDFIVCGAHSTAAKILVFRDEASTGGAWGEPNANDTFAFLMNLGTSNGDNIRCVAPTNTLNDTALHHWVGTFAASGKMRIYKDGVLVRTSNNDLSAGSISNSGDIKLRLGNASSAPSSAVQLQGDMDDVRMYNRELTASEVETIYNARGADGIINGMQFRLFANQDIIGSAPSDPVREIGPNKYEFSPSGANLTYSTYGILKSNKSKSFQG